MGLFTKKSPLTGRARLDALGFGPTDADGIAWKAEKSGRALMGMREDAHEIQFMRMPSDGNCESPVVGESVFLEGIKRLLTEAGPDVIAVGEWDTKARVGYDEEAGRLPVHIGAEQVGWLNDDLAEVLEELFINGLLSIFCDAHVGWNERVPFDEVRVIGVQLDIMRL